VLLLLLAFGLAFFLPLRARSEEGH
jgi:hypothetical protein